MLGPSASQQWQHAPEHLAMVLARYRAAAALIGRAETVLELGCGEGIGARMLAAGRRVYVGVDYDPAVLAVARDLVRDVQFDHADVTADQLGSATWDAAVALDVIEHLDAGGGERMVENARRRLKPSGVLVVGTPSACFEHLASPASKNGHVTLYDHDRLFAMVAERFHVVQSFGMQDVALHLGHPDARHYLLLAGIMPR